MGAGEDRAVVLAARAKLNLGLEVLRRRRDGYHDIRSLILSIDLSDRLEIRSASSGEVRLRCPGGKAPENEENLVFRAARLFRDATGERRGARIVLRKRIPVGAGLGGGSSDAAATLIGLNRLWGSRLPRSRLETLASEIGSDVPFFIRGGLQMAEGRGEKLTTFPAPPPVNFLVIYPTLSISTASVYSSDDLLLTRKGPLTRLSSCSLTTRSGFLSCVARLRNDLEPVVVRRHAEVERIFRVLREIDPRIVRMTGSGSAVFVCDPEESKLAKVLKVSRSWGWQVFRARGVGRGWISIVPRGARKDSLG